MSSLFSFGRVRGPRVPQVPVRRPRRPLALEMLEDRAVPTVFNVNSLADTLAPPAGVVTLRSAIQAANATPGGNTINLTVAGDYRINLPGANTGTNNSGAFAILPGGGNLSIVNTSGGFVAVDGAGLDRVFDINPAGGTANPKFLVTIQGITIENGLAQPGDGAPGSGGGIRDQGNASLSLINDVITNNTASADGGGISMENLVSTPWTLTLQNTTVSNNRAGDAGGGVETDGTGHVNITGSTITGNISTNQGAGVWLDAIANGAGVLETATLNITTSNISFNSGIAADDFGGGIGNAGNGAVTITSSTVANNFINGTGGGFGDQNNLGSLTVLNSTFTNNSAVTAGGGIQEGGTSTIINDSTITGNDTLGNAGGVFVQSPIFTLNNTIIAGNVAGPMNFASVGVTAVTLTSGGGVVPYSAATTVVFTNATGDTTGTGAAATVTVSGGFITAVTITNPGTGYTLPPLVSFVDPAGGAGAVATSTIGAIAPDIFAAVTTGSGNFIGTADLNLTGIADGTNGNRIGTITAPLNPLLGPLQNNGGPTFTRAPLTGSPVIDAGINTVLPATDPITGNGVTDQRGFLRIVNARVDIGAVEFQPGGTATTLTVSAAKVTTGKTVTLTAKVAASSGAPNNVPTGSVTFFDGTTQIGIATLDATGTATFTTSTLPAGVLALTAVYTPDATGTAIGFTTSTSAAAALHVLPPETIGVFNPATATWYLRNENSAGGPDAGQFQYGGVGWYAVTGDWLGNGQETIAVIDPTTMTWYVKFSNAPGAPDLKFQYGPVGSIPIVGDWTGTGHDGIGVYDPTTATWFLRNEVSGGAPDAGQFQYGMKGWLPVVGDWTGKGKAGIGVVDPTTETWYLRNTASAGGVDFTPFSYGAPGWKPVAGDWTGTGHAGIGVVNPTSETWYLRNEVGAGGADAGTFQYGGPGWTPVVGRWQAVPGAQLQLAQSEGPGAPAITNAELQSTVQAALQLLKNDGVDPTVLGVLASAHYNLADLPSGVLGETYTAGDNVFISADAAGNGWFVDPNPQSDTAFDANGNALPGSAATGHEDLLTTVLHEMGHLVGRPDETAPANPNDLMAATLPDGSRHLEALDQVFGSL